MDSARQAARAYLAQHHLGTDELWLHYWSNGGQTIRSDFGAFLDQLPDPSAGDQQVLTWALQDLAAENAAWPPPPPAGAGAPGLEILP
jgi:hypothetical protein